MKLMENNNIIGYVRVSTDDQKTSLLVQQEKIRDYCIFKNLNLVEIIIDKDVSGFKHVAERPGGSMLIKKINELNIKNVVVIKPDRLFRNTVDALHTMDSWNKENIALHVVDVGGVSLNTQSAIGRLMFTTIISFAEFERNITGERTKSVLNNRKSDMATYSRPVFGFNNNNGKMEVNSNEMETVKKIQHLNQSGLSTAKIAEEINKLNLPTKNNKQFKPSTINYILKNKIYQEKFLS